jgi:carbon-monoxide dehydrogenase medium subunit
VIPAAFDYVRAGSVDEAVAALTAHGDDAKLLAGGHSLLPMMKMRLAVPTVLVDVARVADARGIRVEGDDVVIGALTRHRELVSSPVLRAEAPLLALTAAYVGDPQIRNRGTIGGSLAHADPAADLPAAVLASDATLVAQGPGGLRTIPATEFFTGYFETALGADEMLVELRVPRTGARGAHYEKFTRRANDWAIVGVATVAGRVALTNMADTPVRARAVEDALAGGSSAEDAAERAAEGTAPTADMHADQEYRRHLARVLTRRALLAAAR